MRAMKPTAVGVVLLVVVVLTHLLLGQKWDSSLGDNLMAKVSVVKPSNNSTINDTTFFSPSHTQQRQYPRIFVYPDNLNPTSKRPSRDYFQLEATLLDAMRARGRIVDDPDEAKESRQPSSSADKSSKGTCALSKFDRG